jgi:hypothetical protein
MEPLEKRQMRHTSEVFGLAVPAERWQRSVQSPWCQRIRHALGQIGVQLRPVLEGVRDSGGAYAASGVAPLCAPFIQPSGLLSQDLKWIDPIRMVTRLIADEYVIRSSEDNVVRVLTEKIGKYVAMPEDHIQ